MYVDNIVDSILKGLGKQVAVMGINILDLITTISFIYFLLPVKGINGYIIVLFISEFLNSVLSLILLIKETKLNIDFSNWFIKPFFSLLIVGLFFKKSVYSSLFSLIFNILTFCACYFICIFLLRGIVKSDLKV